MWVNWIVMLVWQFVNSISVLMQANMQICTHVCLYVSTSIFKPMWSLSCQSYIRHNMCSIKLWLGAKVWLFIWSCGSDKYSVWVGPTLYIACNCICVNVCVQIGMLKIFSWTQFHALIHKIGLDPFRAYVHMSEYMDMCGIFSWCTGCAHLH